MQRLRGTFRGASKKKEIDGRAHRKRREVRPIKDERRGGVWGTQKKDEQMEP